ncbi:MAG: prolipoprotein diacylglyceryl transferase [Clostridiales bacterium]|nr:prolipoprotein diacylglyceryl transferase [Clostridiales bacterium]
MTNIIGFPGLGMTLTVNRVAFTVFGKDIYWYALCILTGYLAGMAFVTATCKKRGVEPDNIFDICFYGLIFGLIGARIYYCIFDWDSIGGFWGIFRIWEGGIAIYGSLIGAILSTYVYCRIKKLKVLKVFDVCVPGLFIGQIIGRWGNFFNAEVYGRETDCLLRMTINGGAGVHPLFLYEGLWNLAGLILLLIFRDRKRTDGQPFFFYVFWYGLGRLFLEGMRQSEYILYVIPGVLGISQVVAFLGIILGAAGMIYLQKYSQKTA